MTPVTDASSAWSVPNFRRLWTASAASSFGSEVAEIVMPLLAIVTLSASAAEVGWLRAAQFLPFLLVTLPLGVVVDRWARRRLSLLIGADLGRFVLFAAIAALVWSGVSDIEPLYLLVFGIGTLTVLYQIADFAFLPSVVHADQLIDANGKIAATTSANEIAGRGLGGLLVQAVSAPGAVVINAVAFGVSGLALRRIKIDPTRQPDEAAAPPAAPRRARREVAEGLRHALGNRYIRSLLGEATTFNLFNELFVIGLLLWTVRDLGLSATAIGLVFTAGGLGSFLGAWFGSRITGRFGYGPVLITTMSVGNSAPLGTALVSDGDAALIILCALFVLIGVGSGIANVHAVSLRQTTVSEQLRGRVNAAYRLISWGVVPLGAAAGGLVAGQIGGQGAMLIGAGGMAVSTLWVAFSPVRRLRRISDARPASGLTGP